MFLLIYYKSLWKTAAMRGEIAQRMKIYKNIDNSKLKTWHSNLEMEAEYLTKTLPYLNLNISRTKNGRNKL